MFLLCSLSALQRPSYYLGVNLTITWNSVRFSIECPLLQWWLLRMQGHPSTKDYAAPLDLCENEIVRSWPWACTQLGGGGMAVHSHQGGRIFPTALSLSPLPTTQLPLLVILIRSMQSDVLMLFNCALLWLLIILSIYSMCLLAFWDSISVNSLIIYFAHFFY